MKPIIKKPKEYQYKIRTIGINKWVIIRCYTENGAAIEEIMGSNHGILKYGENYSFRTIKRGDVKVDTPDEFEAEIMKFSIKLVHLRINAEIERDKNYAEFYSQVMADTAEAERTPDINYP